MRKLSFETNYIKKEKASCLISMGNTRVLTVATLQKRVPPFVNPSQSGWLTAEYAMLPRSSCSRVNRERGKLNKRSVEIERLIGRSLRSAVDTALFAGYTILLDADVIEADGGTRTASINGCMVCLGILEKSMIANGLIAEGFIGNYVGAMSVGIVNSRIISDLDYENDFNAEVDMNIVMNDKGRLIEIQGTGEKGVFSVAQMNRMVSAAGKDIASIIIKQKKAVANGFSS